METNMEEKSWEDMNAVERMDGLRGGVGKALHELKVIYARLDGIERKVSLLKRKSKGLVVDDKGEYV